MDNQNYNIANEQVFQEKTTFYIQYQADFGYWYDNNPGIEFDSHEKALIELTYIRGRDKEFASRSKLGIMNFRIVRKLIEHTALND